MRALPGLGRLILAGWVAGVSVAACAGDADAPGLLASRGGAGSGGPKVSSTSPSTGQQGQQLLVRVLGSGFNPTAVATWERNGSPDPKVTVNSTAYVSSTEVLADITIASDADTVFYDVAVEVLLSDGSRKKGVGIEKFEVKPGPRPANSSLMLTGALVSDGPQAVRGVEGETSVQISLGSDGPDLLAGFNFRNTYATYLNAVRLGQAPCAYDPADKPGNTDNDRRAELFAKLVDPAYRARFALGLTVSKPDLGAASDNHFWALHWNGGPLLDSLFTAKEEFPKMMPGVFTTVTETSPHVYQFSGGRVGIIDRTGSPGKDFLWIVCPNLDSFTAEWTPPAP